MSARKFSDDEIKIRAANKEDMAAVAAMIQELADFEKMSKGPKLSIEDLKRDGFEARPPAFECKVAELQGGGPPLGGAPPGAPQVVGYALYFPTYSTWEGRAMMLEDLYVQPAVRRRGVGQRLFNDVAKEAHSSGCSRLDFHVLDWNDAKSFYESKGAVNLTNSEQWCYYRLAGRALAEAAEQHGVHRK